MTPEAFSEAGYKVVMCKGSSFCSPLPHPHCKFRDGIEYCAVGKVMLAHYEVVLGQSYKPNQYWRAQLLERSLAFVFFALHPDWECTRCVILGSNRK